MRENLICAGDLIVTVVKVDKTYFFTSNLHTRITHGRYETLSYRMFSPDHSDTKFHAGHVDTGPNLKRHDSLKFTFENRPFDPFGPESTPGHGKRKKNTNGATPSQIRSRFTKIWQIVTKKLLEVILSF